MGLVCVDLDGDRDLMVVAHFRGSEFGLELPTGERQASGRLHQDGSLRRFARLDQAEVADVLLGEELDNTLTLVRSDLPEGVVLERAFDPVPPIRCFPNQLNQLFMVLLKNAVEACDVKEGRIHVRLLDRADSAVVLKTP